jgi:hypothetical protein
LALFATLLVVLLLLTMFDVVELATTSAVDDAFGDVDVTDNADLASDYRRQLLLLCDRKRGVIEIAQTYIVDE